ncbi:MAG: hypothetical protein CM15mP85_05300 [Rhodobacterales bacterium]|nr:MAG: hypothetical protein CM15mP85_05300 [Rhodobacterales bacterium]
MGGIAGAFYNYSVLAEYLNNGAIRSDDADAYSFFDLGLFSRGNSSTLSITSAFTPNFLYWGKERLGPLGGITPGILEMRYTNIYKGRGAKAGKP